MAGSNAYRGPAAVIDLLEGEFQSDSDVLVSFAENARDTSREHIFGGRIAGPHSTEAFRGGGRRPRREQLTWDLRLWVSHPGKTAAENAQRALDIGERIENRLAAGTVHDGAGVPDLKKIEIVGFAMENTGTDDEPITEIVYSILFDSFLT